MTRVLENRKCSAKTFWRVRKSLEIRGPAFQTVEEGYERTAASAEAWIHLAMLRIQLRRLA